MIVILKKTEIALVVLGFIGIIISSFLRGTKSYDPIVGIYSGFSIAGGIIALIMIAIYNTRKNHLRIMRIAFSVLFLTGIAIFIASIILILLYGEDPASTLPYLGGFMQVFSGPFAFAGFAWIIAVCWFYLKDNRTLLHKHRT